MEYYFNNAGRQMQLLGRSLQARYLQALGLPAGLPEEGYQGDYLIAVADRLVEKHGNALVDESWERFKDEAEAAMFEWIRQSLDRIHIRFDVFFNETASTKTAACGAPWNSSKPGASCTGRSCGKALPMRNAPE